MKRSQIIGMFCVYLLAILCYQFYKDDTISIINTSASSDELIEREINKLIFERNCNTCHVNEIGPSLGGIIGRVAGTYPGFTYTQSMKESGIVWDIDKIRLFISSPSEYVKGTSMALGSLTEEEINQIISYLSTN